MQASAFFKQGKLIFNLSYEVNKSLHNRKVLIVIPCKNEELTVKRTLLSLLQQEQCEVKIVLVDDGSTDATPEIVKQLADEHSNLTYESTSLNNQRESGAGIARVVQYGLSTVDIPAFDYIAKFDADLEFPKGYMDKCLTEFERDERVGLVGGSCSIELKNGAWIGENVTNDDHIRGALKMYRTQAFLDIGGIVGATGWDTIDEHKLRYHNWSLKLIPELLVKQYRITNAATDPKKMGRKIGLSMYNMRYNFIVVAVSIFKRAFVGNSRLPLGAMVSGYGSGFAEKKPRFLSKEEAKLANKYRLAGYYKKLGL